MATNTYSRMSERHVRLQGLKQRIESGGGRMVSTWAPIVTAFQITASDKSRWYIHQVPDLQGADVIVISTARSLTSSEADHARKHRVPVVLTRHFRACEKLQKWVEPVQKDYHHQSEVPEVRIHRDSAVSPHVPKIGSFCMMVYVVRD